MAASKVTNEQLKEIRDGINKDKVCRAWMIKDAVKTKYSIVLDESTIRGRFIEMGEPLSTGVGGVKAKKETPVAPPVSATLRKDFEQMVSPRTFEVPSHLSLFIPVDEQFEGYIVRDIDKRLALHYNLKKYPITQGKQGTGKTYAHIHYAWKNKLPFFLYSCYEDFKLRKIFGDKTIENGSIIYKESLFVLAIQCPSVILFDEINAVSNANSFDFHALLQNRELFVKDADNGTGKLFKLHPECRIGFAQNPKSAKYIGGSIKPSNFLGRCTFITFPEFTKKEIKEALTMRFPTLETVDLNNFTQFYFACIQLIERGGLPLDISIRQVNNVVELWLHGLPLKEAIEDGLSSMLEAVSQPQAKESLFRLAQAVWRELMKEKP